MKNTKTAAKSRRRQSFRKKNNILDAINKEVLSFRVDVNKVYLEVKELGVLDLHSKFRCTHQEAARRRPVVILNPHNVERIGSIQNIIGGVDKTNDTLVVNVKTDNTEMIVIW